MVIGGMTDGGTWERLGDDDATARSFIGAQIGRFLDCFLSWKIQVCIQRWSSHPEARTSPNDKMSNLP